MTKAELKSLWYIKRRLHQLAPEETHERERIERKIEKIEKWIDDIDDPLTHDVFYHRFVKGFRWAKVAVMIGGDNTEDSVRMIVARYLQRQ